jgi:Flp pilus assembly protein TadD
LAEKAVLLDPCNWSYRNTLGVAYYRLGRWRQAADTLENATSLSGRQGNAFDLFFLAMSYKHLGQTDRARECYERANQWWQAQGRLNQPHEQELTAFRAEAAAVLVISPTLPSRNGR